MVKKICYFCGKEALTKEHFPPKSFFPSGGKGLQLKTVPSCEEHNNEKSHLDQYILAHITMNQGRNRNLAKRRFSEAIVPQLKFDEKFRQMLSDGSKPLKDGTVQYSVDSTKFDQFFDALTRAILFDKYHEVFPGSKYLLEHVCLSFGKAGGDGKLEALARLLGYDFFIKNKSLVDEEIHAGLDDFVYRNKVMSPCGYSGSITIMHSFFDSFDVLSLASIKHTSLLSHR